MLARKHGISFAMHGEWLTSLVINDLLEISNKDTDIAREMTKKITDENTITNDMKYNFRKWKSFSGKVVVGDVHKNDFQ